jgi:small subunit ribosomal protein S17
MAGHFKIKTGRVISDKMDKSIVVSVENVVEHPLYKKRIKRTRKFHAHDESNEAHQGDVVRIAESRPMSKKKNWRLLEIIRKAESVSV